MILVTGGTGLVGSHLLYKLASQKKTIRAIYRRPHKLETVKHVFSYYSEDWETLYNTIEWIEADITDIPKLETAFTGITHVYHCAAFISFEPDKYITLRKINIGGTANIVNLCISHAIKKLCYVSSIATIGRHINEETLITEETHWNPEEDNSVYSITKYGAELEVWRGTQEGLDAVIVNPGIIIGPGYWRGGGSGSFFRQIYKGKNYYTKGTSGYVDVYDVVNVMQQLMDSTIKNENYIVVSDNLSFRSFNEKVSENLNITKKSKEIKSWQLQLAWRLDWLNHKLFGKRRKLSKQLAKTIITKTVYDNSKIKNALEFEFSSVDDSIKKVSQLFLEDL
ncbi:NAD-dependent epimerase/dehydratase family protein [Winogradskyella immobilis]|uniref:NAD-dependent epimerase/dehydratase family protein n=1 Tax=Winogradskyella immobilis TaxID=2816852 RepID=A0ABS8EL54_9FLAO|nr:NAD-dependent epimerase/dehydratase family protein [Winogradskyella immobilis]MCC1483042.1 NAD-dependent epimerase/dehydratase family protein [Winogradskyella immobilis]MCG0015137.1 NAD-dependent epimerase/dehydratase family protein [Winogradskyella immobilis]